MKFFLLSGCMFLLFNCFQLEKSQDRRDSAIESTTMTAAAQKFLSLLDNGQKKKALLDFYVEERFLWHYFPNNEWKGLALRDMNAEQREAMWEILKTVLSTSGYKKSREIIELENVLRQVENRAANDRYRDPENYYLCIFGEPGPKSVWGWRFEGHHLSLHFYSNENRVVSETPGFMGSNPGVVLNGPQKGKEVLKDETEKAFELLRVLTNEEKKKAMISDKVPADILTFVNRRAEIKDDGGLTYAEMTEASKKKFTDLLNIYTQRYQKDLSEDLWKEIREAGMDQLRFVWIGSNEKGPGHAVYYRIQGPTLIIEYDNTQNNANHVHTVIRDLLHDFGGDELAEHYRKAHGASSPTASK